MNEFLISFLTQIVPFIKELKGSVNQNTQKTPKHTWLEMLRIYDNEHDERINNNLEKESREIRKIKWEKKM